MEIDLILNADSPAFMRFLFNAVDGYKWNYSPSNASMNGKLGLSGLVNMESSLEDAALSAYLDLEFYDVQIGSFDFEFNGTPMTVYFPDTGTLHLEAQASFADNRIRYVVDDTTSVGGLDRPDGSGQVIYSEAYCPFLVTLVVRETAYFDAKVLFDAIRRMAVSSSLTGGRYGILWRSISGQIQPDRISQLLFISLIWGMALYGRSVQVTGHSSSSSSDFRKNVFRCASFFRKNV